MQNKSNNPEGRRRDDLSECIERSMRQYFRDLDGHSSSGLYRMFIEEVEKPFFRVVMSECKGNLSEATKLLGMHRATLRARLRRYEIGTD